MEIKLDGTQDVVYEGTDSLWITVGYHSVRIRRVDEGVLVGLFVKGQEDHGCLGNEIFSTDEEAKQYQENENG